MDDSKDSILNWLKEEDPASLESLWRMADSTRQEYVGDEVHLRGLIEISNTCVRQCLYCGMRAGNAGLERYRMSASEIMECVRQAASLGWGTVVLQGGEDYGFTREAIAAIVRRIKSETPLAVTLSLGERPDEDLAAWREAGADRYLLRFETSDAALYRRIHPPLASRPPSATGPSVATGPSLTSRSAPDRLSDGSSSSRPPGRIAILRTLKRLGYEIGGGVMIGIPGQSFSTLADDILLFRELDLDMIGVGPFIPHPETPLGRKTGLETGDLELACPEAPAALRASGCEDSRPLRAHGREAVREVRGNEELGDQAPEHLPPGEQVPATELMSCKVIALARLIRPDANIPSTTALATLNPVNGYELGLMRGANVVMPNITPASRRVKYEIYPNKACFFETPSGVVSIHHRIAAIGRTIGKGPGPRGRRRGRRAAAKLQAVDPVERTNGQ